MSTQKKQEAVRQDEDLLCPIRYIMSIFSGKWKLPIVCMLSGDTPLRYSTIKRRLGDITNVMLSQSLKDLEAAGIVHREQFNEVPPRVEYTLTEKGISVLPALEKLGEWAIGAMQEDTSCGILCTKCQATT
ncbi:winged helix-turn-helix transcriptional regulator [Aminipila luticellarii]|uniref:Transcriptional regulator n=1 Tax=Aminipila luticellarii TaxID=2507160 RepID=A0A410PVM0_9FIRM|nr:helix-turn-helix domain-containing protein [Aminipila luticellarii]QAT42992.1 transcriptional regulator [Aminipila luticellarii]